MSDAEDERAWQEITKAMRALRDSGSSPRMIILPELSLPQTRLLDFEKMVSALNIIAIVGTDYLLDHKLRIAKNQAIVFVPNGFFKSKPSGSCARVVFGKTFPAPQEREELQGFSPSWSFEGEPRVYVFDCESLGQLGVSICYDFMDVERALMFRGKIQHLLVLSYNRDLKMFQSLADSLSRTVFCNVVVCNTGFYGGSVAVSPYYEAAERTLYSHSGAQLFTTQVVHLPVASLIQAQRGQASFREAISKRNSALQKKHRKTDRLFKNPPPGFEEGPALSARNVTLKEVLNDDQKRS
jgi:predicted amidohydrolase